MTEDANAVRWGNLRTSRTALIGREVELTQLDHALADAYLVTLVGPPGVGKSRLARAYGERAVARASSRFAGGVWICDLSHVDDVATLLRIVGSMLPAPTELGRALVILDGVDSIAGAMGSTLSHWLDEAPAARWIVTSGRRVGVEGEWLLDVAPLAVEGHPSEASALFEARAREEGRHEFDDRDRHAIHELVRHLDGLPLAIELAAALTRLLSPCQILDQVRNPDNLVDTLEPLSEPSPRPSLRDAIHRSWQCLEPGARSVLSDLSVFVGTFDWAAACAVLGRKPGEPQLLRSLASLERGSLLSCADERGPTGAVRYHVLSSIRRFAHGQLDPTRRETLERAHTRYYLDAMDELEAVDASNLRASLTPELANLTAIHRRATTADRPEEALAAAVLLAALAPSRSYEQTFQLLDETIASSASSGLVYGRALEARGTLLRFLGRLRESRDDLQAAEEMARAYGDPLLAARACCGLGNVDVMRALWGRARDSFLRALRIYEEQAPRGRARLMSGRVRTLMAAAFYNEECLEEASEVLERALPVQSEMGDRAYEGMSRASLGIVALAKGNLEWARAHLEEALQEMKASDNQHWEGVIVGYLGALALEQGDLREAQRRLRPAAEQLAALGIKRAAAIVTGHRGAAAFALDRLEEAEQHYRAALRAHRQTGPDFVGLTLAALAAIAGRRSNWDLAEAELRRAEAATVHACRASFRIAVDLYRGVVEAERARAALESGDERQGESWAAKARARLRLVGPNADNPSADNPGAEPERSRVTLRSTEARSAWATLRRSLSELELRQQQLRRVHDPAALVVDSAGRWFRAPHATKSTSLDHRKPLQRVLRALMRARLHSPAPALPVPRLVAQGWPGEKILAEAGRNRVYAAVAALRRMGLRDVILREPAGYVLDPAVDIVVKETEAGPTDLSTAQGPG